MAQRSAIALATLSGTIGLAIGAVAGALLCGWFLTKFFGQGMVSASGANLVQQVHLLKHLDAGDTKSLRASVESNIDVELVSLRGFNEDGYLMSRGLIWALETIQSSRQKSGYVPEDLSTRAEVARAVKELSAVEFEAPNNSLDGARGGQ